MTSTFNFEPFVYFPLCVIAKCRFTGLYWKIMDIYFFHRDHPLFTESSSTPNSHKRRKCSYNVKTE